MIIQMTTLKHVFTIMACFGGNAIFPTESIRCSFALKETRSQPVPTFASAIVMEGKAKVNNTFVFICSVYHVENQTTQSGHA